MSVLRQLLKKIQPSRSKKGHQMNPKCVPCWWFQPLKNISQNGNLPQIWVKEYWNHHPGSVALARIMPWSVFQWAEDPFFFQAERWEKPQFWGGCQVSNLKLRVKMISSRKHVLVPHPCCKIHNNVWNYMIYIAHLLQQKKNVNFLDTTVLTSYIILQPFSPVVSTTMPCFQFFFILPIPLSLPNDGTAFPAAFAKSRVPGKMAWDPRRRVIGWRDPKSANPSPGVLCFFLKSCLGEKKWWLGSMTNFITMFLLLNLERRFETKEQSIFTLLWAQLSGNDYMWFFQTLRYIAPSAEQNAKVRSIETWALHVFCCSKGKRILFESLERGKRLRLKVEKG